MRSLPKPNLKTDEGDPLAPVDVFKLCISVVRNRDLKARLQAVSPLIAAAAREYDDAAEAAALHLISRQAVVGGNVTNAELVKVYTGRMVPASRPGRVVYDAILAGAPGDRCPLCGVGTVTTLDHHLPKGEYSCLTVTPNNLVPSCDWCQGSKMDAYPAVAAEQTIHPYFDDFESDQWLAAVVCHTAPATFAFSVQAPLGFDVTKAERARHHMKTYALYDLFSDNAAEELINIRDGLSKLLNTGGAPSVKAQLSEQAASRKAARLNSWPTAMYEAAANDDWFARVGSRGSRSREFPVENWSNALLRIKTGTL